MVLKIGRLTDLNMARDFSTQFFGDCDQMYRENGLLSIETLLIIFSFEMFHSVWMESNDEKIVTQTNREITMKSRMYKN